MVTSPSPWPSRASHCPAHRLSCGLGMSVHRGCARRELGRVTQQPWAVAPGGFGSAILGGLQHCPPEASVSCRATLLFTGLRVMGSQCWDLDEG